MPKFTTPSNYLRHQELDDTEDTIVTIDSFANEEVGQGDQKKQKWVLYFTGMEKGLVLNSTNGKVICKLYGEEMDEWIGKNISLYIKDDVQFKDETVSAIRVRPKAPNV